jgi:hypothetical protein
MKIEKLQDESSSGSAKRVEALEKLLVEVVNEGYLYSNPKFLARVEQALKQNSKITKKSMNVTYNVYKL